MNLFGSVSPQQVDIVYSRIHYDALGSAMQQLHELVQCHVDRKTFLILYLSYLLFK